MTPGVHPRLPLLLSPGTDHLDPCRSPSDRQCPQHLIACDPPRPHPQPGRRAPSRRTRASSSDPRSPRARRSRSHLRPRELCPTRSPRVTSPPCTSQSPPAGVSLTPLTRGSVPASPHCTYRVQCWTRSRHSMPRQRSLAPPARGAVQAFGSACAGVCWEGACPRRGARTGAGPGAGLTGRGEVPGAAERRVPSLLGLPGFGSGDRDTRPRGGVSPLSAVSWHLSSI